MKKIKKNYKVKEEKQFVIINLESANKTKIEQKTKFIFKVNENLKLRDLIIVLKKKLHLRSQNALYLFSKDKILNCQILISDLRKKENLKKEEIFLKFSEIPSFGRKKTIKINNL